jgi:hypothetical protein
VSGVAEEEEEEEEEDEVEDEVDGAVTSGRMLNECSNTWYRMRPIPNEGSITLGMYLTAEQPKERERERESVWCVCDMMMRVVWCDADVGLTADLLLFQFDVHHGGLQLEGRPIAHRHGGRAEEQTHITARLRVNTKTSNKDSVCDDDDDDDEMI